MVVLPSASAAPFDAGNVVVYRVGSGSTALTSSASPVFLDEYTLAGTLVQSLAMPTVVNGTHHRLVATGTGVLEGQLNLSLDGQYLTLTGYDANVGTTNLYTSDASVINRVVGRVDLATGAIDTTTGLNSYNNASTGNIRGAVTNDGTSFWTSGIGGSTTGGLRYSTLGASTSTQLSTTIANLNHVEAYGGRLFVSSSTVSTHRISVLANGMPTSGSNAFTALPGVTSTWITSPIGFFLADLDDGTGYLDSGLDTLYVADDGSNQLIKFTFDGTTFQHDGAMGVIDPLTLDGRVLDDGTVELFAAIANGASADTLVRYVDTSGFDGTMSLTSQLIATANANTAFRGVAFLPEPGAIVLPLLGIMMLLKRRRRV